MKQYKAIFLDWDDTIGDWSHAAHDALCDLYRLFHLETLYPTAEDFVVYYEPYNLSLWERYGRGEITKEYLSVERFLHTLTKGESTESEAESLKAKATEMGKTFLLQTNRHFSLLPHAEEVVRYLAGKYPLTIISNGFKEVQYYKFSHSGLQDCFAHLLVSEEVGVNKPQPEIFRCALELNGVTADEALMIGDSLTSDIAGAQAAGIDSLWIQRNHHSPITTLQSPIPTYAVTDIREIRQLI